jgi:hypothetical protein
MFILPILILNRLAKGGREEKPEGTNPRRANPKGGSYAHEIDVVRARRSWT